MVGQNKEYPLNNDHYWYRQRVVDKILELHNNNGNSIFLPKIIEQRNISLIKSAIILFGSWHNAVLETGIRPEHQNSQGRLSAPRSESEFWTPEKVMEHIKILFNSGFELSAIFIKHVYPELYYAAKDKQIYDGWWNALSEAEVDNKYLHSYVNRFWTLPNIFQTIKDYDRTYGNLQPGFIRDLSPSLYFASHRYFKTWPEVIRTSGLNPNGNVMKVMVEPLRSFILKEYVKRILSLLGVEYRVNPVNTSEQSVGQYGLPELWNLRELGEMPEYFLETNDLKDNSFITCNYRSWERNSTNKLYEELIKYQRIIVYYSIGEPRQWLNNKIEFINVNQFYPELATLGMDDIISDLRLIARGGIPKAYQNQYNALIRSVKKKRKDKKNHRVHN